MGLRLRVAQAADAAAVASLHAASWRDAYRGVLDDAFLDGPLHEAMARHWQERLALPRPAEPVILAVLAGEPAGFVAVLRDGPSAQVDNLHVRPGLRGAGIGRLLLHEAASRLRRRGCTSAWLSVFARNLDGIRFYRALGGVLGPEEPGETMGQAVLERRCTWPDIGVLIAATARR